MDTKGKVVTAGLYLDPNGPHPINSFGCTICHGGQGSGTDFTFSSHTPSSPEEEERWKETYGWQEIHHWDYPMLPKQFVESSCVKCHHQITDIPQAAKLQAGYQRIVQYGCTGCHLIGGEGSFGPDLTDERTVGPNLSHIGAKLSPEWVQKWIKDPHAFRPDSRMPRFYGLTNNDAAEDDIPKGDAEIQAIAHYLFSPEHVRRPTSSIPRRRPTPSTARSCSCRRAAWPAISIGPMRPTPCSRPTATSSIRTTSRTRRSCTTRRPSPSRFETMPRPTTVRTWAISPPSSDLPRTRA